MLGRGRVRGRLRARDCGRLREQDALRGRERPGLVRERRCRQERGHQPLRASREKPGSLLLRPRGRAGKHKPLREIHKLGGVHPRNLQENRERCLVLGDPEQEPLLPRGCRKKQGRAPLRERRPPRARAMLLPRRGSPSQRIPVPLLKQPRAMLHRPSPHLRRRRPVRARSLLQAGVLPVAG